jgi:hypothetical protein
VETFTGIGTPILGKVILVSPRVGKVRKGRIVPIDAIDRTWVTIRYDQDGVVIIGTAATPEAAAECAAEDRVALPWDDYPHISSADREIAARAVVVLGGLSEPRNVFGRDYQVVELPDDLTPAQWVREWRGPTVLHIVCAREGQLRVEIYPNEGQHRGRPHCKVTYARRVAGSFGLPDGEPLHPGRLGPHEAAARKLVRKHGRRLLDDWFHYRPDDQRLH